MRGVLMLSLLIATVLAVGLSAYFWGMVAALITLSGSAYLAIGFWITENIVGVLSRVKVANGTAIAFLMMGKVLWLGSLFLLAKSMPPGQEIPAAMGMGAFLLALLVATFSHFGMPKVSDATSESRS